MAGRSYFFILGFLFSGCTKTPQERILQHMNPTFYVYRISEEKLRSAIISEFKNFQFRKMILYYPGGFFNTPRDSTLIFKVDGNKNDFYLAPYHYDIGYSCLYGEYPYIASFHLHIEKIDSTTTKVIVNTIKPRIAIGREFFPSGPHFVRTVVYLRIRPSTCEEYEILQRIGRNLNEPMPALLKPTE